MCSGHTDLGLRGSEPDGASMDLWAGQGLGSNLWVNSSNQVCCCLSRPSTSPGAGPGFPSHPHPIPSATPLAENSLRRTTETRGAVRGAGVEIHY